MRALAVAIHFLAAASLIAQQPPIAERIEVSVVNVDVNVSRADGQPVRGLSRDDFQVFEDGRAQPITNFYAVEGGAAGSKTSAAQAGAVGASDSHSRRRVLALIDVFHTTRQRRVIALASLEKLIDDSFETGEYDWSLGILGRGVTIVLPLTTDKLRIHNMLDRMVKLGERTVPALAADVPLGSVNPTPEAASSIVPDSVIDRAMSYEEVNRTLAAGFTARAIVDAVRGFAGTPGRKILLLLTGDLGMNDLNLTADNMGSGGFFQRPVGPEVAMRSRDITDLRTMITRESNASAVSMYIFNIEGLQPLGEVGVNPKQMTNSSAAFWLSKDTGGRLLTGNDATAAVRQFDSTSANYYSLGYRSPHAEDNKYHRIEVRLKNANGAHLDYRSGYTAASSDVQIARAMESPIAVTLLPAALPVALIADAPQPDRRGVAIPINVKVPFASLQFLPADQGTVASVRIFISVFDDAGKNIFSGTFPLAIRLSAADPRGVMVYKNMVVLRKGTKNQIVAAVKDDTTDNVGSASITIAPE